MSDTRSHNARPRTVGTNEEVHRPTRSMRHFLGGNREAGERVDQSTHSMWHILGRAEVRHAAPLLKQKHMRGVPTRKHATKQGRSCGGRSNTRTKDADSHSMPPSTCVHTRGDAPRQPAYLRIKKLRHPTTPQPTCMLKNGSALQRSRPLAWYWFSSASVS